MPIRRAVMPMAKLFTVAAVLTAAWPARAQVPVPDFKTLPAYSVECESMALDRTHVTLRVEPSTNIVTLLNAKGETFDFPVTRATVSLRSYRNQFGHYGVEPFAAWEIGRAHV